MAGKIPILSNGPSASALPNYPKYRSKSNRKLWSLHDRLAMSAHVLNANLAEDGCPKAQLDVAKKLLYDEDSVSPTTTAELRHENARLAIYWLIKSSTQGNKEATDILRECYTSGRGITCQNILDVKTCLNTSTNEKLTFVAARLLYDKLRGSENFISTTQILARLQAKKFNKKVSFQGDKEASLSVTEDDEIEGEGDSALYSHDLNETFTVYSETEDQLVSQILSYSLTGAGSDGVKLTQDDLIKIANQYNAGELPMTSVNPENSLPNTKLWDLYSYQSGFLLQFLLLGIFGGVLSIVWALYYGVLYICLWSLYNFILWRKRKAVFEDWSNAFRSVLQENASWSEEVAYKNFRKKYFYPSLGASCLSLVILYFMNASNGINSGKILLGTGTILGFSRPLYKWQLLLIFLLQILQTEIKSMLPLEGLNVGVDIPLPLPDIGLIFSGIQTVLAVHFILELRNQFTFEEFLPEGIAVLWSISCVQWFHQLSTDTANQGSFYSLTSLVFGITIILLGLSFCSEWKNLNYWRLLVAGSFIGVIGVIAINGINWNLYTTSSSRSMELSSETTLDWYEYQKYCHRPAWKTRTLLQTEVNCMRNYYMSKVEWEGTIEIVKVKKFLLPNFEPKEIEIIVNLNKGYENQERSSSRDTDPISGDSSWTWKHFVAGSWSDTPSSIPNTRTPISLLISTVILNDKEKSRVFEYLHSLRAGDHIEFIGNLNKNLGGFMPEIQPVQSISCRHCEILETNEMFNCVSEQSINNLIEENYVFQFIRENFNRVKTWF